MKYFIEDTTLRGIADAIREKDGTTEPILTEDMASRIEAIESGGSGIENLLKNATWEKGFISSSGALDKQSGTGNPIVSNLLNVGKEKIKVEIFTDRPPNTIVTYYYWIAIAEYDENGVFKKRTSIEQAEIRVMELDLEHPQIRVMFRSFEQDNDISAYRIGDLNQTTVKYEEVQ